MLKVLINYKVEHELQVATLLKKAFKSLPGIEVIEDGEADIVINTLPRNGYIQGKKASVFWDLETAEWQCPEYFDQSDIFYYPNNKNIHAYDSIKEKAKFLPLATDKDFFHYYPTKQTYDIVFCGREDTNRQIRIEGLNALEAHCKDKGYKFLRCNGIKRGEDTSKVISIGKLTIQIAGLRNLEQRVFENSPIRPQLVDVQETNVDEMEMIDAGTHSFIPFYYKDGDWSDLLDNVDYYLSHDSEREAIVENARKHFFALHTYKNRAAKILFDLKELGKI